MKRTGRAGILGLALVGLWALAAPACDAQAGQDGLTAADLEIMIDTLLPTIAEVSGMEVRRPVQYAMQSREDARAFIEGQIDDVLGTADGPSGMERAYKALGLVPDTLDLRSVLLDVYSEQIVGYYDPASDRLYVLEGAPAAMAAPVVAHELVHALQDQHVDLEALTARERGNDRQTAASAAAEGQAMLVMLGVQVAQSTGTALDLRALPDLSAQMAQVTEASYAEFPVFRRAPRLVRETMLFPYVAGAGFVQALFRARGDDGPPIPFGDLLPQSTEQVLSPEARFLAERDEPTELTLGEPGPGWQAVYSNTLGQLEASILLVEHLGQGVAGHALGWDGDRYVLLVGPDSREALVWYSVWDDAGSADRFAAAARRFPEGAVTRTTTTNREVVRVVFGDPEAPVPSIEGLSEEAL